MDRELQSSFFLDYVVLYLFAKFMAFFLILLLKENENPRKPPSPTRDLARSLYMRHILKEGNIKAYLRMDQAPFYFLAHIMREKYLLRDTLYVSIEEQLAHFLHVIGHNTKNRIVSINFHRSGETVSRHFNEVLHAIGGIRDMFMQQANADIIPEIEANPLWYPWFKDCIGLVDGTLVPAKVPLSLALRFIGRKPGTTQNILAAATPNKCFTYVLAGWEGSAHDYTVLKDALSLPAPNGLKTIEGKFYLVDGGFPTMPGFIAPYKRTRYHLKEQCGQTPKNRRELFNLRHSSLRISIESAFGILKGRFKILCEEPFFPFETQVDIALACFILHNFILQVDPKDYWANHAMEFIEEDHNAVYDHAEGYAGSTTS